MSTINQMRGRDATPTPTSHEDLACNNTCIGFELEINNCPQEYVPSGLNPHWNYAPDHSLRQLPMEFVFNGPKHGAEITEALVLLYETHWNDSWNLDQRGSTHCHLDIRDFEIPQIGWLTIMAAALEEHLFSLCGSEYRRASSFTRSLNSNSSAMRQAMMNITNGNVHHNTVADNYGSVERFERTIAFGDRPVSENLKYQAVNLGAIARFGSVEFRHFRPVGTVIEALTIINTILKLSKAARADDPVAVFTEYFGEIAPESVEALRKYDLIKGNM